MTPENNRTLVQCDFDGTITDGDVSFQILDEFSDPGWRDKLNEYMAGKISVNRFNASVFSKVKVDKETLDNFVRAKAVIRPGLDDLLQACRERDFRFVIVSNGMMFYIDAILKMLKLNEEFVAARANFKLEGMEAWYEGPDGQPVEEGFKEAYTNYFLRQGYRIIYMPVCDRWTTCDKVNLICVYLIPLCNLLRIDNYCTFTSGLYIIVYRFPLRVFGK